MIIMCVSFYSIAVFGVIFIQYPLMIMRIIITICFVDQILDGINHILRYHSNLALRICILCYTLNDDLSNLNLFHDIDIV